MKRTLVILLLCCLALTAGCTLGPAPAATPSPEPTPEATSEPSPTPTSAPTPTAPPTPTPEPTPCPHLVWVDGVCADCGAVCPHPEYADGACSVCGVWCRHPEHDPATLICPTCGRTVPHNFLHSRCDMCGAVPEFRSEVALRSTFTAAAPAGTVETITYLTHDYYEEGQTWGYAPLKKEMLVYLPAGYDPSEKYDLMVLMHGMDENETYWLQDVQQILTEHGAGVYTPGMLNNLMNTGYCRKMIIATPCFYRNSHDFKDFQRERDEEQFLLELRNDILPTLVDRYSTYARSSAPEDISAARNHFAYAGLSLGSIYAWTSVMPKCLDLFAWFGCFCGSDARMEELVTALQSEENAQYPILYFYNCIGTKDSMYDIHYNEYYYLVNTVDCLTDGDNAAFTVIKNASHEYRAWGTGLYNFLRVVFAQPEDF